MEGHEEDIKGNEGVKGQWEVIKVDKEALKSDDVR